MLSMLAQIMYESRYNLLKMLKVQFSSFITLCLESMGINRVIKGHFTKELQENDHENGHFSYNSFVKVMKCHFSV